MLITFIKLGPRKLLRKIQMTGTKTPGIGLIVTPKNT